MRPRRLALLAVTLVAVAGHALAGAPAAGAPRVSPVKIGVLSAAWGPTRAVVGLREGLQALGYRENADFVLGVRFTQGEPAELPAAARELVRLGPDIIVTDGSGGETARAAQTAAGGRVPVVFMGEIDPVGRGLVPSLARPGGTMTGIANLDAELCAKRLEILHDIVPAMKRVLLPYDATEPGFAQFVARYRAAAQRLGITLVEKPLRNQDEARTAVADLGRGQVDAIVAPRWLTLNIPGFMLEAAGRQTAPTMFSDAYFVERGGLVSYAANTTDVGRQAARLVDRIMKGAKPADLPVEQPTTFELVLNLKTAAALGLTIPPAVLVRADRTIQ
jgi:putative tryptophan/tyrosine transport system substrate-binding protein